jgi:hypothetical protein
MSTQRTDQKRDTGAPKNRGRFAIDQLAGNGVELMQEEPAIAVPVWGEARRAELEADVEAKAQSHRFAADYTRLLREQGVTARRELAVATTQREAAAAGAELAEVEFMCDTADLEEELAIDDLAFARARLDVHEDLTAAIDECVRLRSNPSVVARKRVADLIHALDLETDEGAGHIAWHPFASESRTDAIRELEENLEMLHQDPQVPAWTERLLQLKDPLRVRRVEIQARRSPTPGTLAQLEMTRTAQAANDGVTNLQPGDRALPRAPRR